MEAYCFAAYAEALEVIPTTLAENAGLNPIAMVTELRNRHANGEKSAGINVRKGVISNILEENVLQPLLVSTSAIELATETVGLLLRIDDYHVRLLSFFTSPLKLTFDLSFAALPVRKEDEGGGRKRRFVDRLTTPSHPPLQCSQAVHSLPLFDCLFASRRKRAVVSLLRLREKRDERGSTSLLFCSPLLSSSLTQVLRLTVSVVSPLLSTLSASAFPFLSSSSHLSPRHPSRVDTSTRSTSTFSSPGTSAAGAERSRGA
jgi:hypothetical protein